MDETPPLPDLHQSEIDAATLCRLFADLHTHARIVEIIPKAGPGYVGDGDAGLDLDGALELLQSGSLRGLQVRYLYQEKLWWDTIMCLPAGKFRIVRIHHDTDA